jgi:hypothetical protein
MKRLLKNFGFERTLEWRLLEGENSNFTTATLKGLKKVELLKTEIRNKPDSVLNYHSSRP